MRSRVFGQVDQFGGLANAANGGLGYIHRIAHQGDDAAVVIGVHLAVEQIDAVHFHGFDNGVDFGFVAPFREVGYTFDECGHKDQDKTWGGIPAGSRPLSWRFRSRLVTRRDRHAVERSYGSSKARPAQRGHDNKRGGRAEMHCFQYPILTSAIRLRSAPNDQKYIADFKLKHYPR